MEVTKVAKESKQKKKKGRSIQQLIGIKTFTKSGIKVGKDELFFFAVAPTNISVLSAANIEGKIRQMMGMISAVPEIEISCTDSSECFDDNKLYLKSRLEQEPNPNIRKIIIVWYTDNGIRKVAVSDDGRLSDIVLKPFAEFTVVFHFAHLTI